MLSNRAGELKMCQAIFFRAFREDSCDLPLLQLAGRQKPPDGMIPMIRQSNLCMVSVPMLSLVVTKGCQT